MEFFKMILFYIYCNINIPITIKYQSILKIFNLVHKLFLKIKKILEETFINNENISRA